MTPASQHKPAPIEHEVPGCTVSTGAVHAFESVEDSTSSSQHSFSSGCNHNSRRHTAAGRGHHSGQQLTQGDANPERLISRSDKSAAAAKDAAATAGSGVGVVWQPSAGQSHKHPYLQTSSGSDSSDPTQQAATTNSNNSSSINAQLRPTSRRHLQQSGSGTCPDGCAPGYCVPAGNDPALGFRCQMCRNNLVVDQVRGLGEGGGVRGCEGWGVWWAQKAG
jgi:hypothetical protein